MRNEIDGAVCMKNPEIVFKFCPQCGSKSIALRGSRSVYCPDCDFLYYFNAAAAVVAVITSERGMLLTVRAHDPQKGALDLPGGFVEPGETAEESLRREIREELGIELKEVRYFASFPNTYLYHGITYTTLDFAFHCTTDQIDHIRPADDVESCVFVEFDRIEYSKIGFDSIRNIIRTFIIGAGIQ